MLRTIGVLPALTKRELKVADEFLVECQRYVKAMASAPVFGIFLGITLVDIAIKHLVVGSIEIAGTLIVVI